MFSFANPEYLYLLLLLPVVGALYLLARRARQDKMRRYGELERVEKLSPAVSPYKPVIRITLELLLLAVVIVMLARPRAGVKQAKGAVSSIEVMLAIDVSNSMDASSTSGDNDISRLQRAKLLAEKLVDRLKNEKTGLMVFAGDADMVMPLTVDNQGAKMYLKDISTTMATSQGTAIGEAIDLAQHSFSTDSTTQKARTSPWATAP